MAVDHLGDVVPIERITDRLQRFKCIPYSIEMDAGACVRNYETVASPDATPDLKRRRGTCLTCVDGRRIREQLQENSEKQKTLNEATRKAVTKAWDNKKAAKPSHVNDSASLNGSPPAEPEPKQPTAKPKSKAPRCQEPGCQKPPGFVRANTSLDLVGYCGKHRQVRLDSRRHAAKRVEKKKVARNYSERPNSSPAPKPKPVATQPASLSLANPSVLADLHNLCVNSQRYDLAVAVGNALAASVRERAEEG